MTRAGPILLVLLLTASPDFSVAGGMPSVGECLSGAAVQEMLAAGKVRRLAEIRRGLVGEIVRADLCRSGNALVYRVTLLDAGGRVRRILLDASSGRMLYDGNDN